MGRWDIMTLGYEYRDTIHQLPLLLFLQPRTPSFFSKQSTLGCLNALLYIILTFLSTLDKAEQKMRMSGR